MENLKFGNRKMNQKYYLKNRKNLKIDNLKNRKFEKLKILREKMRKKRTIQNLKSQTFGKSRFWKIEILENLKFGNSKNGRI